MLSALSFAEDTVCLQTTFLFCGVLRCARDVASEDRFAFSDRDRALRWVLTKFH